jgi:YD repeat-containing protein
VDVTSTAGGAAVASQAYGYNTANQRIRKTEADGSYWIYEYDTLGQVIAGRKYWADATPVAGQQFEYAFDDIGNRKASRNGGDQTPKTTRKPGRRLAARQDRDQNRLGERQNWRHRGI